MNIKLLIPAFTLLFFCNNVLAQAPATPTITGSTTYCEGGTLVLTANSATAGVTYTWNGPGTGFPFTGNMLTIPNLTIGSGGIYTVTATNGSGASAPTSTTIKILSTPPPPYTKDTVISYCQFSDTKPLNVIGSNILWYTSASGGVGSTVIPTPSSSISGTFDFYATQTATGCESKRLHIQVNIIAKPGMPGVSPVTICQNSNAAVLTASGSNLLWYTVASGGIGSRIAPIPGTSYAGTFYYYVSQTINGCESDRAALKLTVNYTPNALILPSQPYVCQHDTMNFRYYGNADNTASYNWTMPNGATVISGSGQGPIVAKLDTAGMLPVTLTVTKNGCSSPLATYLADVRLQPIVPVVVNKDICVGQILDVSLGYANETIDNYNWDFNGGFIEYGSIGKGPYGIIYNVSGTNYISLTTSAAGCSSVTTIDTINVHPLADAHIGYISKTSICQGDSVSLEAERYNGGYLYQWSPASFFGTENNQGTVDGQITQSGYVYLTVTTEYGCVSRDSSLISAKACCEVYFPNAFTPNGDGKNDIFRPIGKGRQDIKTFRIIDRWGKVVFETTDQNSGWDGRTNGTPQDIGTYEYYIRYQCANGKYYDQKGDLMLIR